MEYKKLNPISKRAMYLANALKFVLLLVMVAVAYMFVEDILFSISLPQPAIYIAVAAFAMIIFYLLAEPLVFYNRYRYSITDDCIDVRRGVIIIRRTVVPIERVHQVEVIRGPILNAFKLATVCVTTAGGVAAIQYQELEEAEEIAVRLNTLINHMVRVMKDGGE